MHCLEIQNLEKSFGELQVLKDISMQVEKGEVVSIIGPSGSGKSTLLRCITMLEPIGDGAVSVAGLRMFQNGGYTDKQTLRNIRLRMGMVFQDYHLFPHFSILKNIMQPQISVLGRTVEQAKNRALALLAQMGLQDKADAYPCQLSGGQQQRASIARALAMDPEILFFDEPTSALDPELTQEVLKVIRNLADAHMTMVIVTHEMNFARKVSNRVIFMDKGVIVEQGAPDDVLLHPTNERTRAFIRQHEFV